LCAAGRLGAVQKEGKSDLWSGVGRSTGMANDLEIRQSGLSWLLK